MLVTIGFLTVVAEIGWNALNRGRPGRRKWRDHCITYMAITAFLPPLDRTLTPWISRSICVWPFIVGWFPKWHLDSPPAFNARCISDTILSFLFAKIVLKSIFLSYKRLMVIRTPLYWSAHKWKWIIIIYQWIIIQSINIETTKAFYYEA